jgi:transposase
VGDDRVGSGEAGDLYRPTLHAWVRRDQIDSGRRAGVTSDMAAEVRKLRAENKELKRANEILKSASVFFAAALDRQ